MNLFNKSVVVSALFQLIILVADAAIPQFSQVTETIFRGGRPDQAGLEMVDQKQVKTVISIDDDVANINWEKGEVARLGMRFISSPMVVARPQTDAQINLILSKLQDPTLQPIFIHCQHGRDRTGLIIGLYRVLIQKWAPKDAYREMLANGYRKELVTLDYYFRKRTGYTGN